ncbi:MAG: DUF4194 domain-containing protein [Opitutales bacterium]|nr:DUF4194 domain-containing protein [Opitutales bacterium]
MIDTEISKSPDNLELSPVVIHLLKGVLYLESDPKLWASLLRLQARVREYVQVIGLELVLDEAEGYAFLRSTNAEEAGPEDGAKPLPRLIPRRQLSFPVSLLLALLRKRMAEADSGGGSTRLVMTRDEIVGLMRVFLAESSNEARIVDQIDAHIAKAVDLGFLRKLKSTNQQAPATFEVLRILKAFVDAQWLAEFDARLTEYAQHALGKEPAADA